MIIVATTSLPAVNRPNPDHWNAARSCQFQNNLKNEDNLKKKGNFTNEVDLKKMIGSNITKYLFEFLHSKIFC